MKTIRTILTLLILAILPATVFAAGGKGKATATPQTVTITVSEGETNKPVKDAEITFYRKLGSNNYSRLTSIRSAENGKASIKLPSGFYNWSVSAPGYGTVERNLSVDKKPQELTCYLRKEAVISGQLVNSDGQAMSGIKISVGRLHNTTTAKDGKFRITALNNSGYEPAVRTPGYVLEKSAYIYLSAGENKELGAMILKKSATLQIRTKITTSGAGQKLDKISINMNGNNIYRSDRTDKQGKVSFANLPPGHYSVSISDERIKPLSQEIDISEGKIETLELQGETKPASLSIEEYSEVYLPERPIRIRCYGLWVSKAEATLYNIDSSALFSGGITIAKPDDIPPSNLNRINAIPVSLKGRANSYTNHARFSLPGLKPGAYLIELRGNGASTRFAFLVTRLGVIAKVSPKGTMLFATDLENGRALADVSISNQAASTTVKTNQDGITAINTVKGGNRLAARIGSNLAFIELPEKTTGSKTDKNKGYIYTDRPAYRPGQTVYFKGIVRQSSNDELKLAGSDKVSIAINDSGEKAVCEQLVDLSANGSFNGECVLPAGAALGGYGIVAGSEGSYGQGSFKVLEYRKPEFEVKVTPDRRFLVVGDNGEMKVTARYYFGAPVANGKVAWRLYNQPAWWLDGQAEDDERGMSGYSDLIGESEATLDSNGLLTLPVKPQQHDSPQSYTLEVDITDKSSRQVSASGAVTVVPSLLALNVKSGSYLSRPGQAVEIKLHAATWEGKGVAAPLKVTFEQQQYNKKNRSYNWRPEQSINLTTDTSGTATTSYRFPTSGYWQIRVDGSDQAGRKSSATTSVWVWKDGYNWEGSYRELEAEFDKKSYKPGETARLIVRSPATGGNLLLTIEGSDIKKRLNIPLKGMVQVVELPVLESYAPYIHISAIYVNGGRFYNRTLPLKVDHQPGLINVNIKSDKPVYAPGDKVRLTVSSTVSGKPVPAELSIAVVDEAIYAIAPERGDDIYKFFRGSRENQVTTLHSFPRVYLGGASKDNGAFKAKEDELKGIKVRKIFKDTAFWQPMLTSNPDGSASAEFTLPDNLTTWRSSAIGHTVDNEFGSGRQKFIARLELMARLSPPRFFTVGDELNVPAVINSMTDDNQTAKGRFEASGLKLNGEPSFSGQIAPKGTLRYDVPVKAEQPGSATLRLMAKGTSSGDAMELEIPVKPRGINRTVDGGIALRDQDGSSELILPDNALADSAVMKLSFAPTVAKGLNRAISKLVEFPYGCVEQTLSRFIPAVHAKSILGSNNWQPEPALAEKLPLVISEGIKRLEEMQHEDGGWGWWKKDSTSLTMTAHAMYGLGLAKKARVEIPSNLFDNGMKSLEAQIGSASSQDLPRAYRALTINGKRNPAIEEKIEKIWNTLSIAEQLAYSEALSFADQKEAAAARLKKLRAVVKNEGTAAYILDADADSWWYGWRWGSSAIETTSSLLSQLVRIKPDDPLAPKLAEFLARRQSGGWWQTTSSSAAAIIALSDYIAASGEATASYNASLFLNNDKIADYVVTDGELKSGEAELKIAADRLHNGSNRIRLVKNGNGAAYLSSSMSFAVPPEAAKSSSDLKLERTVYRISTVKKGNSLERQYTPLKAGEAIMTGDNIEVRLLVENKKGLEYVIIEDKLPAGFESRNTELDPEFRDDAGYSAWYSHNERRDDRMAFFITTLPAGKHEFRHVIYAELSGQAIALPASTWPMYQPEIRGESRPWQYVVKDKK